MKTAASDSVIETIGWTPLIRLNRIARGIRTPIYGKADFFNPGGSVKDRIGAPIIEAAERSGALRPGGTIVEGTSGNTGVGLAIAAALTAVPLILIARQPDLGTAVTLIPVVFAIAYVAGMPMRIVGILALVGVLVAPVAWKFALKDYQKTRITTFINPELDPQGDGYQQRQARITVGSGGL